MTLDYFNNMGSRQIPESVATVLNIFVIGHMYSRASSLLINFISINKSLKAVISVTVESIEKFQNWVSCATVCNMAIGVLVQHGMILEAVQTFWRI